MRTALAAVLAAAALVPSAAARAADPPCQTADALLETAAESSSFVCAWQHDVDYLWFFTGGWSLACDAVYGTLPGTTTPTMESGSATCRLGGAIVDADTGHPYALPDRAHGRFRYWSTSPATIARSEGTFQMDLDGMSGAYMYGTYTRVGALWTFQATYVPWLRDWHRTMDLFAGTAVGLPATQGYPLMTAAGGWGH